MTAIEPEPLLTPGEVAKALRVDPKTVSRWARAGKLNAIRTPGGHRRFRESEVRVYLEPVPETPEPNRHRRAVAANDPAVYAALGLDEDTP